MNAFLIQGKSVWIAILALTISIIISSCELYKPNAIGNENEIFVFADSIDWPIYEPVIKRTFEKEIITPQYEKIFNIKYYKTEKLNLLKKYRHIIFLASLASDGLMSNIVKNILSDQARMVVESGEHFLFTRENQWARGQLLMILVANDPYTLVAQIDDNQDILMDQFEDTRNNALKNKMFKKYEQKALSDSIYEKYGWTVRLQHDYVIAKEDPENHFIWLRRFHPDRWLFVYWEEEGKPEQITPDWFNITRKYIASRYFEESTIEEDEAFSIRTGEFLGRKAIIVNGLWKNEKYTIGGPFRSWLFYDEKDMRTYLIDIAVLAPNDEKEPFLRQLDIIAHTFRNNKIL